MDLVPLACEDGAPRDLRFYFELVLPVKLLVFFFFFFFFFFLGGGGGVGGSHIFQIFAHAFGCFTKVKYSLHNVP